MADLDQPGKDVILNPLPDAQDDFVPLQNLYSKLGTVPNSRIAIGVLAYGLSSIIVPQPRSYEDALLVAFHKFGQYIPVSIDAALEDLYLFRVIMGMSDTDLWAEIPRGFDWPLLVRDGDCLTVMAKSLSTSENNSNTVPSIKYIELFDDPSSTNGTSETRHGRIVAFPRPSRYAEARMVALLLFFPQKKSAASTIRLFNRVKDGSYEKWQPLYQEISDAVWKVLMQDSQNEVGIAVYAG